MNLNIKKSKRLLDLDNPNHGLLLPILTYCVDKKGTPVLGKPQAGARDRALHRARGVQRHRPRHPALRELHYVTRYDDPE
ncbi:hypothetical protein [Mesorhizobium sp. M0676]|uniref:hypothetical protein n=1 Tax=Mesorhizobium sp. M0676 TaxID=2956984 RepID=UPI00333B91E7